MEKKYRLKEEAKKYLSYSDDYEMTLEEWNEHNLTLEALEEVEEKIELMLVGKKYEGRNFIQSLWHDFTTEDVRLCSAILNASESTKEAVLNGWSFKNIDIKEVKERLNELGWEFNTSDVDEIIDCLIKYLKT